MAYRTFAAQQLHDRVIQAAFNNLDKITHDIYINPGEQQTTNVNSLYPDIIITRKNDRTVQWIIEVETTDSINQGEAINQWLSLSKLGGAFYLLVPSASRNLAEQICIQNNIKARFGIYTVDMFNINNIQIKYE